MTVAALRLNSHRITAQRRRSASAKAPETVRHVQRPAAYWWRGHVGRSPSSSSSSVQRCCDDGVGGRSRGARNVKWRIISKRLLMQRYNSRLGDGTLKLAGRAGPGRAGDVRDSRLRAKHLRARRRRRQRRQRRCCDYDDCNQYNNLMTAHWRTNDECAFVSSVIQNEQPRRRDNILIITLPSIEQENNCYKCFTKLWFRHELTANDTSKTAKITKRWYYPPAHRLNVNVLLSNITFL